LLAKGWAVAYKFLDRTSGGQEADREELAAALANESVDEEEDEAEE
jgi:hypothetical protein